MKEPNLAPVFATMYPGLCYIARNMGYALAIHGSLQNDLDLIAVPWREQEAPKEHLVDALKDLLEACLNISIEDKNPEEKPHGRIAYNLFMINGCKINLSIV
jgi:hypothetical protein